VCSSDLAQSGDLVGSMELDYTNDSTIRSLTSTSLYPLFLMNSFGNKIYNVTLRGNGTPLDIELSNDNEVYNSVIENPTADLLYFYESYNNTIYNNLMNSSTFYFDGFDANNWNTSKQSGTRIYTDGNQIGGNYWTNSTGNGFSDTCVDNNTDGFCDDPYVMDANETDYLPLSNQFVPPSSSTSNIVITVNVSQYVNPLTIIKDENTSVVQYSGSNRTISLILNSSDVYSVNITGNQIYPFFGYFNATIDMTFTATPRSSMTSSGDLLTDVGSGIGSFLSAMTLGVTQFMVYIAIIMGVLTIFYAIAYVFKKFTGGNE
jgi:hypothetical protein